MLYNIYLAIYILNFTIPKNSTWEYCEKNVIMTSKEFGDNCREWAKKTTLDEEGRKFILRNKSGNKLNAV